MLIVYISGRHWRELEHFECKPITSYAHSLIVFFRGTATERQLLDFMLHLEQFCQPTRLMVEQHLFFKCNLETVQGYSVIMRALPWATN